VILSLPPLTSGELREVLITLKFIGFLPWFSILLFGEKFSVYSSVSLLWKLLYCVTYSVDTYGSVIFLVWGKRKEMVGKQGDAI